MAGAREKKLVSLPGQDVMQRTNPEARCPICQRVVDACTHVDPARDAMARPGDLSVCANCGALLIFLEDLRVRGLTREEFEELPADTRTLLVKTQLIMRAARRTFFQN